MIKINCSVISFILLVAIILFAGGCRKKTPPGSKPSSTSEQIPISSQAESLAHFTSADEFKEYYGAPVVPPPFDFTVDLSKKSLSEVRLLHNEIFARHGYLTMDAVLRGYFNQFPWYQPIFWDSAFSFSLSDSERAFVQAAELREKGLESKNFLPGNGSGCTNIDNVVNLIQFKEVPPSLLAGLRQHGFAFVEAKHEQLFHLYDKNQYEAIPSFVTTDLYLQLLHVYYTNLMRNTEEQKLYPQLNELVETIRASLPVYSRGAAPSSLLQASSAYAQTYFAIAGYLLTGKQDGVPPQYQAAFANELQQIAERSQDGSEFLNDPLFDYTQLIPRGHYTRTDTLKKYFAGMKWLITAPFMIASDTGLASAILTASIISREKAKSGIPLSNSYTGFDDVIGLFAGDVDNLGPVHLWKILKENEFSNLPLEKLLTHEILAHIRNRLAEENPERIIPRAASEAAALLVRQPRLFFIPARYTLDGEILQRLTQVTRPHPARPYPKGLDVFAALGNKEAESILLDTYREAAAWPAYRDTLQLLQHKFSAFQGWNDNAYDKRMETILSLLRMDPAYPCFTQTPFWQRRCLNTSLASWTELKHEVILYAKEPSGAECGEGGGPPPPNIVGYVEPNPVFWNNCISLLNFTQARLSGAGVVDSGNTDNHRQLLDIGNFCATMSSKEINHTPITQAEFDRVLWIGGECERLTLSCLGTDFFEENSPDKEVPVVADVYSFNNKCLEEAVGLAHEIYVAVEINGLLYLTRGAVFSQYEFLQPSTNRLTDEAWQKTLSSGEKRKPPVWLRDLYAPVQSLETKSTYSYNASPVAIKNQ